MYFARAQHRFSRRVFLVFVLALLAVSTLYTAFFVRAQAQRLEAALVDRSRGLGGLLATGARVAVYSENPELVQETLSGVAERRDVLSAAVFTLNRQIVAAAGRTPALKAAIGRLEAPDLAVVERLGLESGCVSRQGEDVLDAFCPVLLRERGNSPEDLLFEGRPDVAGLAYIGFVRVALDRRPLRREIGLLVLRSLALMAIILLLGSWAAFRFARRVTEPLERLTEAVRLFGASGEIGALPDMPDDEIGRLAEAFVRMTHDLETREREKERLAEQLQHAQQLEAVGRLSQGLSHDFKNILSTLKTAVHILEKGKEQDEFVLKYTGRMQLTLERARELVERLLLFSRTRKLHHGVVDLSALLGGLAPAFRMVLGEQVRLLLESPGCPVAVRGDLASLEQLLMNLIYNARDAMPAGGVLGVRLEVAAAGSGEPPVARISVSDTGAGMAPEVSRQIFEPFFTTKDPGSGMGLGLSIVHGIVEEHRGQIRVRSAPGAGTTFEVDLPLVQPAESPADGRSVGGAA